MATTQKGPPSRPTAPPSNGQVQAANTPQPAKMVMPSAVRTGCRVVFIATEGYGKTTTGALGESPVIVMTPDERGYLTLASRGLVPQMPVMMVRNWPELLASLHSLATEPHDRKTVVLDAMAGMESLLARHVCQTEFDGDWGEKGFQAWGRGKGIVMREWPNIFPRLTAIANKGIDVLILGHARVKRFQAPEGADYDRYECNVGTDEVWARTKAWAEAVLFGNFRPIVEMARPEANTAKARGKAIAHQRIMRCQYSAVADAKNQYGLEAEYAMPDNPQEFAASFWAMVKGTANTETK